MQPLKSLLGLWSVKCFPGGLAIEQSSCNVGDLGSIPGLGRSPGEGNGYPLQYSCLENSMDRGTWQAIVHGVAKSRTWLNDFHSTHLSEWISTRRQKISAGEGMEKMEPSCTVDGIVNRNSHYGKHYGDSSKNLKKDCHMIQQFHFWVFTWRKWKH